jgi:hypothetical protein
MSGVIEFVMAKKNDLGENDAVRLGKRIICVCLLVLA